MCCVGTLPKGSACHFATPCANLKPARDHWEVLGSKLIRHHVVPRTKMFIPHNTFLRGVDRESLLNLRVTHIRFVPSPSVRNDQNDHMVVEDNCASRWCSNRSLRRRWVGSTEFTISEPKTSDGQACPGKVSMSASEPGGTDGHEPLKVKLLHPNATLPVKGSLRAAGFDITAAEEVTIQPSKQ